jgi:hypothetical protein
MSGYEMPEGWDPENPYYPEEWASTCIDDPNKYNGTIVPNTEVGTTVPNTEVGTTVPNTEVGTAAPISEDGTAVPNSPVPSFFVPVPKIIVESNVEHVSLNNDSLTNENNEKSDCDNTNDKLNKPANNVEEDEDDEEEESYWSCDETHNNLKQQQQTTQEDEDDDDGDETEGEEDDCVEGIVEEPIESMEEASSRTIDGNVQIEEYLSSESSESRVGRLSRITELSGEEFSSRNSTSKNSSSRNSSSPKLIENEEIRKKLEELFPEEEEQSNSSSEEEEESVSVIEKSMKSASESKREDWTTSESSEEESDSDEVANKVDDDQEFDQNQADEDTAVTVRLPLKLSFSKTKSYKDITTVLVCDVDDNQKKKDDDDNIVDQYDVEFDTQTNYVPQQEEEEQEVSFTISLSRQHSREEEEDKPPQEESLPSQDIDFWGQIIPKESPKPPNSLPEESSFNSIEDFWGNSTHSSQETVVILRKKTTTDLTTVRPSSCGFNFWDKPITANPIDCLNRRFSGNFEISEDYESDSGMKSDSGDALRMNKLKVKKKYTHHRQHANMKRHFSIPAGLPIGTRATSVPRKLPTEEETTSRNFFWESLEQQQKNEESELGNSDQEKEQFEESNQNEYDDDNGSETELGNSAQEKEQNHEMYGQDVNEESQPVEKPQGGGICRSETAELTAGWSFWDELQEAEKSKSTSPTCKQQEQIQEFEEPEVEVSIEIKLPKPTLSNSEISAVSEELSSDFVGGDEENEYESEEEEDKLEEEANNSNDLQSSKETQSDESSSKSSCGTSTTTTIQQQPQTQEETPHQKATVERPIQIQNIPDAIKIPETLEVKPCTLEHHNNNSSSSSSLSPCSCHIGERMARAESLLWRIERFLHESLSLGSEDDSGVMTDLSRQISDVDTDADNDQNDSEFLLTAASTTGGVIKRHTGNASRSPVLNRRRPKSEIILLEEQQHQVEQVQEILQTESNSVVKLRGTAAERKALRYQRAKTHSRLFQLLQDESTPNDDDEDEEFVDCVEDYSSTKLDMITTTSKPVNEPIAVNTTSTPAPGRGERSRLLPLPIRSHNPHKEPTSDSTSSPSDSSSGVLSPTSPVNRESNNLLADIINEFHLRHQQSFNSSQSQSQLNKRRFTKFPSRIFKLLQDEFGEEFYQTFDCGDGIAADQSLAFFNKSDLSTDSITKECTIHKSDSLKALEELFSRSKSAMDSAMKREDNNSNSTTSPSSSSSKEFLEVPLRRMRDFRTPKRTQ